MINKLKWFDYDWYQNLNKSKFTPNNHIFRYVWSILYIFIFITFISIINEKNLLNYFYVSFLLNIIWIWIFFKFKSLNLSLLIIILLYFSIILLTIQLYLNQNLTYLLQIPYLLWLSIAVYFNIYIYMNN